MARTIKARHMMISLSFGLPMPLDDAQIEALALAWVNFQSEYPATRISRKLSVVIDLASISGSAYLPLVGAIVHKAQVARAQKKQPFRAGPANVPPIDPHKVNGHAPGRQAGPSGDEIVIMSGVPDGGKIDFNS